MIKFRLFTVADFEDEEKWLRDMHRSGWKLVKMIPPFVFKFEACEPEDVIYRLDFKDGIKDHSDYMQMFKDFGWEYCGRCFGWQYFRRPAAGMQTEEEGEIFSDNKSKCDNIGKVIRTRFLPLLILLCVVVIPNTIMCISERMFGMSVFYIVMLLIYIALILHCGFKLNRLRSKYGETSEYIG